VLTPNLPTPRIEKEKSDWKNFGVKPNTLRSKERTLLGNIEMMCWKGEGTPGEGGKEEAGDCHWEKAKFWKKWINPHQNRAYNSRDGGLSWRKGVGWEEKGGKFAVKKCRLFTNPRE